LLLGWYGQFFAVGNGLFVYAPYLGIGAGLILFEMFWREHPGVKTLAILTGTVLFISVHARWFSWMGGWSWGPRRMIPLYLVFHLPLAQLWIRSKQSVRTLLTVGVIVSIFFNLPGLISDFSQYYQGHFYQYDVLFSWEYSQIYRQFLGIWQGRIPLNLYWLNRTGASLIVPVVLTGCGIFLFFKLTETQEAVA